MAVNPEEIIQIVFMVVWGKSIPCAQLHGYNHQTTSKANGAYVRPLKYACASVNGFAKKVGAGQLVLGNDIDAQCKPGHWSFSYRHLTCQDAEEKAITHDSQIIIGRG